MDDKIPVMLHHVTDPKEAKALAQHAVKILAEEYESLCKIFAKAGKTPLTFEEWLSATVHNMRSFLAIKGLLEQFSMGPAGWGGKPMKDVPDTMVN